MRPATQAAAAAAAGLTPNPHGHRLSRMRTGIFGGFLASAQKIAPLPPPQGDASSTRAAVYKILERPRSSRKAFAFFTVIVVSILLSTVTYLLSTVDDWRESRVLIALEVLCNVVFSVELMMRVYAMPTLQSLFRDSTFYVDVLSLVPFYLDVRQARVAHA